MKKKIALAFFLAALTAPAFAQYGLGDTPGFYAGGTLGINGDDEVAWRALLGYQANRNFALELGYHDLGKHNIAGFPLESNAVEVLGVGRLPLNEQAAVYGKLGGYRSESKGGGANETQHDITFGVAFEYALSTTSPHAPSGNATVRWAAVPSASPATSTSTASAPSTAF